MKKLIGSKKSVIAGIPNILERSDIQKHIIKIVKNNIKNISSVDFNYIRQSNLTGYITSDNPVIGVELKLTFRGKLI